MRIVNLVLKDIMIFCRVPQDLNRTLSSESKFDTQIELQTAFFFPGSRLELDQARPTSFYHPRLPLSEDILRCVFIFESQAQAQNCFGTSEKVFNSGFSVIVHWHILMTCSELKFQERRSCPL